MSTPLSKKGRASTLTLAPSALALILTAASVSAAPWSFGIISDTQWKDSPDGKNPNRVAVNVINHLNDEFIKHKVKLVVAVGDLTQDGDTKGMDTTATFRQALYNAGIGFYPLRGNHEDGQSEWQEFARVFPQTGAVKGEAGWNNKTPSDAFVDDTDYGPQDNTRRAFKVGSNFASEDGFEGLTYSFDYKNVRFVLIDQFMTSTAPDHSVLTEQDVNWVCSRLAHRSRPDHAFVFAHKHLMSEDHEDTLFGADPSKNPDLQNRYMSCLDSTGVRYHIGGHDHMHNRAVVTSPDGESSVQDIVTASDSYKFYTPVIPSNDETYNIPANGIDNGPRETVIAQELYNIGYYIVTVDGPRATVDYYASPNGCDAVTGTAYACADDQDQAYDVIPYNFTKRETFGYSLNGQEFLIPQGESYEAIKDSFRGTTAKILDGANGSSATVYDGRATTKAVDTGWTAKSGHGVMSHILTLWGMSDLGTEETDTFVLSMNYQGKDAAGLATKDADGNWVRAVDMNLGDSSTKLVRGPWKKGYGLGTYGIDTDTKTAWAVINYNGDFAVTSTWKTGGHRR